MRRQSLHKVARPAIDPADPAVDQPVVDPADVIVARSSLASAPDADEPGPREPQARVDPGALRREVFGFLPYWQVNSTSLRIQYDKISTIAYFGVGADAAGNLQKRNADGTVTTGWAGWTSSRLTSIIDTAHGTGTPCRPDRPELSHGTRPARLARRRCSPAGPPATTWRGRSRPGSVIVAPTASISDFEPLVSGMEGRFVALIAQIRQRLDAIHRGYQITFDTTGHIGNYPIERATTSGADAIFIMGYDYRGSTEQPGRQRGAAVPLRLRHPRDGRRVCGPRASVEADPRRAVLRAGVVDR
jgi:hypothetical protein